MSNIIITGANQGIGFYFIEQLLEDGNKVSVLDLEIDNLKGLKDKYKDKLICFEADIRNMSAIQEGVNSTVEAFKTIDIAVHNACLCTFETFKNTDEEIFKDVIDVNYFGALRLVKTVLPFMQKQKKGKIIFTSSGASVTGFSNISPYVSSKGAIESLAKSLRLEYQNDNISFHLFHPPLTRTKSAEPLPVPKEFQVDPKIVGRGLAKHIHSNRYIICHNFGQKVQIMASYLLPIKLGQLMSKMTAEYKTSKK